MTNDEKIKKIQYSIDHPGDLTLYYKLLEDMGDIKYNYQDYMITNSCDRELERLPEADYELSTALLTMLLREDHFCNVQVSSTFLHLTVSSFLHPAVSRF